MRQSPKKRLWWEEPWWVMDIAYSSQVAEVDCDQLESWHRRFHADVIHFAQTQEIQHHE